MEPKDYITIAALLLGPVLAVVVSEVRATWKENRERKIKLFQALMSTRANRLNASHVDALNMIDIVFYGEREITDSWKMYHDHLNQSQNQIEEMTIESWNQKALDLMNEMLFVMAKKLSFDIDKLTIKKVWYSPKLFGDIDKDNELIRKGFAEFVKSDTFQKALLNKPDSNLTIVQNPKKD